MDRYAWLIWSMEHGQWWRPARKGYTTSREDAGRYTYDEAVKIVREGNFRPDMHPHEAMIRDESYCCAAPMVAGGLQCEACGSDGL